MSTLFERAVRSSVVRERAVPRRSRARAASPLLGPLLLGALACHAGGLAEPPPPAPEAIPASGEPVPSAPDARSRSYSDTFWCEDAEAGTAPPGLASHRIRPGRGLVLATRRFHGGEPDTDDDEHFEKLTFVVPDPPELSGEWTGLGGTQVAAYYSAGSSAWPSGHGRRADDVVLWLRRRGDAIDVRAGVAIADWRAWTLEVSMPRRDLADLTPWEGGPGGEGSYAETHPSREWLERATAGWELDWEWDLER